MKSYTLNRIGTIPCSELLFSIFVQINKQRYYG